MRHLRHLKFLKDSEFAALRCLIYNIGASARPMAAFICFYESHGPTPSGDARGKYQRTATAIEMVNKLDIYCIIVLFSVALAAVGAILSE